MLVFAEVYETRHDLSNRRESTGNPPTRTGKEVRRYWLYIALQIGSSGASTQKEMSRVLDNRQERTIRLAQSMIVTR